MWKDALVVAFQALDRLLPGETEVNHKNPHSECSLCSNRDTNSAPPLSPRLNRCLTLPPTRHDTGWWALNFTADSFHVMNAVSSTHFLFMPQVILWPTADMHIQTRPPPPPATPIRNVGASFSHSDSEAPWPISTDVRVFYSGSEEQEEFNEPNTPPKPRLW